MVIIIATCIDIENIPELTDESGSVSNDLTSPAVGKFFSQTLGFSRLESLSNFKSLQLGEFDALGFQDLGLLSVLSSLGLGNVFKLSFVSIDILDELLDLLGSLLELESKTASCKGSAIVILFTRRRHKNSLATLFTAGAVCGMSTADGKPQVTHGESIIGDWVVDAIRVCDYSIVDTDLLGVGVEPRVEMVLDITRNTSSATYPWPRV
ncbi:hypothetical protein HG531_002881 [Fusarium graminearum]|nr:hypothetical protein HG531_002881 [Fusarium graminearum]